MKKIFIGSAIGLLLMGALLISPKVSSADMSNADFQAIVAQLMAAIQSITAQIIALQAQMGHQNVTIIPSAGNGGSTYIDNQNGFQFLYPHGSGDRALSLPFVQGGTNLRAKYLDVKVTPLQNNQSCSNPQQTIISSSSNVTINGVSFLKEVGGDGAAGTYYHSLSYSTIKGVNCISISLMLPIDDISESLKPSDINVESAIMDLIMPTFTFTNTDYNPACRWGGCVAVSTDQSNSNWKTYTNEKLGYSFQYPSDWLIGSDDHICVRPVNGGDCDLIVSTPGMSSVSEGVGKEGIILGGTSMDKIVRSLPYYSVTSDPRTVIVNQEYISLDGWEWTRLSMADDQIIQYTHGGSDAFITPYVVQYAALGDWTSGVAQKIASTFKLLQNKDYYNSTSYFMCSGLCDMKVVNLRFITPPNLSDLVYTPIKFPGDQSSEAVGFSTKHLVSLGCTPQMAPFGILRLNNDKGGVQVSVGGPYYIKPAMNPCGNGVSVSTQDWQTLQSALRTIVSDNVPDQG